MSPLRSQGRRARAGLAAVLLLLAPVTRSESAEGRPELAWRIAQGQRLRYLYESTSVSTATSPGSVVRQEARLRVAMTWRGEGTDPDGAHRVVLVVDSVRVSGVRRQLDSEGHVDVSEPRRFEYDSDDPDSGEGDVAGLREVYGELIGRPCAVTLDARGQVLDGRVPEGLAAVVRRSAFAAVADAGSFLTGPGLVNLLGQVLPRLPDNPPRTQATWDEVRELPANPFLIRLTTRYRLDRFDGVVAAILATLDVAVRPVRGSSIDVRANAQHGTAAFLFDAAGGHLTEARVTQSLDLTIATTDHSTHQKTEMSTRLSLVGPSVHQ
jgi:hypothetical protein